MHRGGLLAGLCLQAACDGSGAVTPTEILFRSASLEEVGIADGASSSLQPLADPALLDGLDPTASGVDKTGTTFSEPVSAATEPAALAQTAGVGALPTRSAVNALFSGHSLLDNPIPDFTEAIARAKGDALGWEEQIIIGSPIRIRTRGADYNDANYSGYGHGKNRNGSDLDLLGEIANPVGLRPGQRYDALVIAERNDPLDTIQWESSLALLRNYHDRITAQQASAQTFLYQAWPGMDKTAPQAWVAYEALELVVWECMAAQVNLSLVAEGKTAALHLIPAGYALAQLVQRTLDGAVPGLTGTQQSRLDALIEDDVHPTRLAKYFLAAVSYTSLFGKSPAGAHAVSEFAVETLAALEDIAQQVVREYAARASAPSMEKCRTRIANEVCSAYDAFRDYGASALGCADWGSLSGPFADVPAAHP
jgi:hypothetical protein